MNEKRFLLKKHGDKKRSYRFTDEEMIQFAKDWHEYKSVVSIRLDDESHKEEKYKEANPICDGAHWIFPGDRHGYIMKMGEWLIKERVNELIKKSKEIKE